MVLKIGGSLQNQSLDVVCQTIQSLRHDNHDVAVVHGGGPAISAALVDQKLELPFSDGRRVTPAIAMPIIEGVLWNQVNGSIVAALSSMGLPVIGIHGGHGIVHAGPLTPGSRTGRVDDCRVQTLQNLLDEGRIPVIAPLGCDELNQLYNVNADETAGAIAGQLGAEKLIFFTDVSGVFSDFTSQQQIFDTTLQELETYMERGAFASGMIPKVEAMCFAAQAGVSEVYVIDGHDVTSALWSVAYHPSFSTHPRQTYGTCLVSDRAR